MSKKYNCVNCEYSTNRNTNYKRHLMSKLHKKRNNNSYLCRLCNLEINNIENHIISDIHKENKQLFIEETKNINIDLLKKLINEKSIKILP